MWCMNRSLTVNMISQGNLWKRVWSGWRFPMGTYWPVNVLYCCGRNMCGTLLGDFQELNYLFSGHSLRFDKALINIAGFQGSQDSEAPGIFFTPTSIFFFSCSRSSSIFSSPSSPPSPSFILLFLLFLLLSDSFKGKLDEKASHHLTSKSSSYYSFIIIGSDKVNNPCWLNLLYWH